MSDERPDIIPTNVSEQATPRFPVLKQLGLLSLLMLGLFGGAYLLGQQSNTETLRDADIQQTALGVLKSANAHAPKLLIDDDVTIEADAAFVWDVANQRVIYEKNADEALPLASITKLMTALVSYEIVDENETVSVPDVAVRQEGDSGLYSGERFNLKTLTDYMLMSSSNDAAYTIASVGGAVLFEDQGADTFIKGMNIRAEELGLDSLRFYNPTGLDVTAYKAGAVGSARDVSFLMEHILRHYPELLDATQETETRLYNEFGEYHESENTNQIITSIPNLIGSKTGYTDLAGGNLTIAFAAGLNRPIVVTVLGSSFDGRFDDVLTLVEAAQKAVTSHTSTEE